METTGKAQRLQPSGGGPGHPGAVWTGFLERCVAVTGPPFVSCPPSHSFPGYSELSSASCWQVSRIKLLVIFLNFMMFPASFLVLSAPPPRDFQLQMLEAENGIMINREGAHLLWQMRWKQLSVYLRIPEALLGARGRAGSQESLSHVGGLLQGWR